MSNTLKEPLKYSGKLDQYRPRNLTTLIGTEFKSVQLSDLLQQSEADLEGSEGSEGHGAAVVRDLAVLISQRGVVVFRDQSIDAAGLKQLVDLLGKATGKPATSGLHIHPTTWPGSELGDDVTVIDSNQILQSLKLYGRRSQLASLAWHSDINFEPVPADYTVLKIHTTPQSGGDTLFADGYEVYNRLSEPYKRLLEGLTAYHNAERFKLNAKALNKTLRTSRGAPENHGLSLDAVHPVVRTNPVTGWKSLYLSNSFVSHINELTVDESDDVLKYFNTLVSENHDLQVRVQWGKNDVAVWDNRSTYHTATQDVVGERVGDRAVGLGERPYLDPNSKGRPRQPTGATQSAA